MRRKPKPNQNTQFQQLGPNTLTQPNNTKDGAQNYERQEACAWIGRASDISSVRRVFVLAIFHLLAATIISHFRTVARNISPFFSYFLFLTSLKVVLFNPSYHSEIIQLCSIKFGIRAGAFQGTVGTRMESGMQNIENVVGELQSQSGSKRRACCNAMCNDSTPGAEYYCSCIASN